MVNTIIYILISVFIVSLISLVGIVTLSIKESILKKILPLLIALSTGSLLGGFFIHILPELSESNYNFNFISLLILFGILLFYFLEKSIHWHHHHTESESENCHTCSDQKIKPVGHMILFSDAFHNFLDGIMIASAFLVDPALGIAATILIILHEIPQEIGDFGILLHAGFKKKQALLFNFISALASFLGAILVIIFDKNFENLSLFLTAIAGGGFLYIAMVDLIPEMHAHKHNHKSLSLEIFFVFLGISLMYLLSFTEKFFN